MAQYPAAGATLMANRLITKSGSSGNTLLPSTTGFDTVSTSATNLTYGSWAQIVASSAAEYLITGMYVGTAETSTSILPWRLDIGTGAGGSEAVKASFVLDVLVASSYLTSVIQPLAIPLRVAASTRIAVRAQGNNVGGIARALSIALLVTPYANVEGN